MYKRVIYLILIIFQFIPLRAEYRTNVHSITRRDGLSNGAVNTIVQDVEGFMWLGTWNGLNRYDGTTITTYLPANDPHSIHNHVIRELYPSSEGPLWMLTNRGIAWYDNIQDQFTSFFTKESEQINYENDIALSYSDRYGALVSVFGRGIFKYDRISRQFMPMVFDPASQPAAVDIKRLHLIGDQAYCITSNGQLKQINGNHLDNMVQLPITGAITSTRSAYLHNRPLILITQRSGAAFMVDPQMRDVQVLRIPDDIITSFALSRDSDLLWAGTERGRLYRFTISDRKFELFSSASGVFNNNLISTRILSIYETGPDLLWIGTDGNGAYTLKLTEFPNKSLASDQLSYPIVRSILVTSKGDLLIGTKGGGIDIFDSSGRHIRQLSTKNGLSNNSVLSFMEREDGSIWAGTDGRGVDIISGDYRTVRNFPRDFQVVHPLEFASVYRILCDSDQHIYLGTSGYGVILVEFDPKDRSLPVMAEQVMLDKDLSISGGQKQIVYALAEERPGIIWVGTRGNGVYRYNTITKRVVAQYSTSTHPGVIRNDDILTLFTEPGGNIWAGSSNGMFCIKPVSADSVDITGLRIQPDLTNISVHGIQLDNLGNLWIATNLGLSLIDPGRSTVRSFNANDGLVNYEYSDGASFFDPGIGRLFVGGTTGVDVIMTGMIQFSSFFPPVAINQFFIRNVPIETGDGSILTCRINHQKTLNLRYNQNFISFTAPPLVYWGQERHRVSYRLINFDDQWVVNPPNQQISFSNLKPGAYILQIRVSDENGNWSPPVKEIRIMINPPFWWTRWAIAGYVLAIFGVLALIFVTYRKREARKNRALLLAFQKKKEEEIQSYKIEFFTNVAHEFRTPLTLITSHIHALMEDQRNTVENPRLLKIFNNTVKLQKLVLEIMQFRKLEKGKEPLTIQNTHPVELIREVVSDLELFAQQGNISCSVTAKDPHIVFKTDADKFQRIMTNLISNAIKYNKPGGSVHIVIQNDPNALTVEIQDTGIGIRPEFDQKVFEPFGISSARKRNSFPGYRSTGLGLAVTKGLVELMQGTIGFTSRIDEGTTFTCVFPDVHELTPDIPMPELPDERVEIGFIDDPGGEIPYDRQTSESGKPLLLLVDDDPEILVVLKDFLQAEYNMIFAADGEEAYSKILAEKPDLMVSDVMMPGIDGFELCRMIRENFDTSHLPIILLAARGEMEDRIAGLKAGADSYIPKPFHPEHLKVRIVNLLQLRASIMGHFGKKGYNPALVTEIPDPFLQKLLLYIDENIDDQTLSAEKICDRLAVSKSSLYNKTRSVLGTTPHSLIYQRRLNKATFLLTSTLMTVSEIIDQTGFSSRTHFYELFNKAFGCSPSEYRGKRLGQS